MKKNTSPKTTKDKTTTDTDAKIRIEASNKRLTYRPQTEKPTANTTANCKEARPARIGAATFPRDRTRERLEMQLRASTISPSAKGQDTPRQQ